MGRRGGAVDGMRELEDIIAELRDHPDCAVILCLSKDVFAGQEVADEFSFDELGRVTQETAMEYISDHTETIIGAEDHSS